DDIAWQLAELADGHKTSAQQVSDRRGENEAARLHADDFVGLVAAYQRRQLVDRLLVRPGLLEQGGDVLEQDPFLRKVGYIINQRCQLVDGVGRVPEPLAHPPSPLDRTLALHCTQTIPKMAGRFSRGRGRALSGMAGSQVRPGNRLPARAT